MYFLHTRTSWDKFMFNGMPNSNFKIGLSLFGFAEKYTEQSTHYGVEYRTFTTEISGFLDTQVVFASSLSSSFL